VDLLLQRHALLLVFFVEFVLFLAMDIDPAGPLGFGRGFEPVDEIIHLVLKHLHLDEILDVEGHEKVGHLRRLVFAERALAVDHVGVGASGEDSAEDVDQEGHAVALVAAEEFALAAEGENAAPAAAGHVLQHLGRARGHPAAGIDRPAFGQRFFEPVIDFQLAPGHHRGGHIEKEGAVAPGWRGQRDRVGADDHLFAEGGHHQGGGVGH